MGWSAARWRNPTKQQVHPQTQSKCDKQTSNTQRKAHNDNM